MYFIESSAYAKLFVNEAGSQKMIELVEHLEDRDKTVSALALIEVRSAIRRRERAGDDPARHANLAIAALQAESLRSVEHPVSPPILLKAALVIDKHGLRTLDALQLATALVARESLLPGDNLVFVCSDARLLDAASAESMQIFNPAVV